MNSSHRHTIPFVILLSLAIPQPFLIAQGSARSTPSLNRTDTVGQAANIARLMTITTDTGRFAPGHRQFANYDTPGLCVAAARTTRDVLNNSLKATEARHRVGRDFTKDSLPAEVIRVARMCGEKFTLTNTSPREWSALFDLALLAGKDSLAQVVLDHRIMAAAPEERDLLRLNALTIYLGRLPARRALAETLAAQIDRDPREPIMTRMAAYDLVLAFGEEAKDRQLVDRIAAQMSTLIHQPTAAKTEINLVSKGLMEAYEVRYELALDEPIDSMHAVAQRAQSDVRRYAPHNFCAPRLPSCRTASPLDIEAVFQHALDGSDFGTPLPPVHAAFWFPPKAPSGIPAWQRDTVFPVPGHITAIVIPDYACMVDPDYMQSFAICYGLGENLRRWIQLYGSQGVSFMILQAEAGHSFLSGLETPAEEAEHIRWYFQDLLGLQATVAVQIPHLHTFPAPDDRHFGLAEDTTVYFPQLRRDRAAGIVLVDANGKVIFNQWLGNAGSFFPGIDDQIVRALHVPALAQSSTTLPAH